MVGFMTTHLNTLRGIILQEYPNIVFKGVWVKYPHPVNEFAWNSKFKSCIFPKIHEHNIDESVHLKGVLIKYSKDGGRKDDYKIFTFTISCPFTSFLIHDLNSYPMNHLHFTLHLAYVKIRESKWPWNRCFKIDWTNMSL